MTNNHPNLTLRAPPSPEEINSLTPDQLVNKLWDKRIRNRVIRTLVGGLNATELKSVRVSDTVREALVRGLEHWSPKVRWWSLQLMDHLADARSLEFVVPLLDDSVQRVRKQARHTLSCEACKESQDISAVGRRLIVEYEAGLA